MGIPVPKYYVPKEQFQIVPLEKVRLYVNNATRQDVQVIIALAWLTGARISELKDLTKDDVMIEEGGVTVIIDAKKFGKIGYPTFGMGDPYIQSLIIPYVRKQPAGVSMFPLTIRSYQQHLENINKRLYNNDTRQYITFHYLRHSRITYLTRKLQASPEEIKSWTGHSSNAFEEYFRSRKVERFRGKIE